MGMSDNIYRQIWRPDMLNVKQMKKIGNDYIPVPKLYSAAHGFTLIICVDLKYTNRSQQ